LKLSSSEDVKVTPPTFKPRILFLHGLGESGAFFSEKTSAISSELKIQLNAEVVYATAPHKLQDAKVQDSYCWWYYDKKNPSNFAPYVTPVGKAEIEYIGWEKETKNYLHKLWYEEGPFHAVFGFSQGARLASLLLGQRHWGVLPYSSLKCGILVGGFLRPRPASSKFWYPCTAGSVDVPALHVRGSKDDVVSEKKWKELVDIYKDPETFVHEGGHEIPESPEAIARYIKFLQQKLLEVHTPNVQLNLGGIQ